MPWLLKKYKPVFLTVLALLIGILLIIVLGFRVYSLISKDAKEKERIDKTTYQAVFLEGGDIYFGKLQDIDSRFPVLKDVYYVRIESEEATTGQVIKLGQIEPHGPTDEMILNRDHILFWENLKPDSRVIQTIRNLKLNQ